MEPEYYGSTYHAFTCYGSTDHGSSYHGSTYFGSTYHAQVEPEAKEALHQQWLDDETRVIVATSAFGMGVHKPDVRLVVHWTMPDSIMALSQEWGRAGRDGAPARRRAACFSTRTTTRVGSRV